MPHEIPEQQEPNLNDKDYERRAKEEERARSDVRIEKLRTEYPELFDEVRRYADRILRESFA